MKAQSFKVASIPWHDPDSGEMTIELETITGQRFTAFCVSPPAVAPGQTLVIETFYWLGGDDDPDEMLRQNQQKAKEIEHLSDWNYFLRGQIVDMEGHTAIVDCGGAKFPIDNFGADNTAVGSWVGLRVERLEAEPVRVMASPT